MDLKKELSGPWKDWWRVESPTDIAIKHIRYSIPVQYRKFENKYWYVHEKHIEGLRQLLGASSLNTTAVIEDPYAVLHLRPTAPPAIIKAVWRELAKLLHPDHGGDPEQFRRAKEAYDSLTKR